MPRNLMLEGELTKAVHKSTFDQLDISDAIEYYGITELLDAIGEGEISLYLRSIT